MSNFPMFSVMGIEIEYMLVDKDTLAVQPKSDLILKDIAGKQVNSVSMGDIALSNELVMHVLELKNNGPKPPEDNIAQQFHNTLLELQPILAAHNLLLLPTGAHPWMNPHEETVRWPHDDNRIYNQYDRIFDCRGHGWANLQSMHVNLPYSNDEEFCQLHNAIRLILPLLPALAASTPILDGEATGLLDSRLYFYEHNQEKLPTITGEVIPEFISTEEDYYSKILNPMYDEISIHDPEKLLQHPWLNSRGAIPKFDQKAIEIRIIDTQECVTADIAIARALFEILKWWCQEPEHYLKRPYDTGQLKALMDQAIRHGLHATIDDAKLCRQLQLPEKTMMLREAWSLLIEKISHHLDRNQQRALEHILTHGNLSERILKMTGTHPEHQQLARVYSQLSHCLLANELLTPP